MDNNRLSILDLNEDCQREIIKYIIADCEMRDISRNNMKYADLINFALAHENLEAILEEYFYYLYQSLELVLVAKREVLQIDFSWLEATYTGKRGEAFWRLSANAIRQNNVVSQVELKYDSGSFHPNFVDHFELIKRALEHKESLRHVTIQLKGYSLEDLNNFGHISELDLDVRMNAEALVEVCKSNPHLGSLSFRSTEILGRLSDIAQHCQNLTKLEFAAKPDNDGVEYAPLAELPKLREMILYGAHENGSVLNIFEAITKWKRPGLQPLEITFSEYWSHLSSVNIARANSFLGLNLEHASEGIYLIASYDFWDISRDNSPLEHSLATIPLIAATLKIDYKGLTLYKCPRSDRDISGFYSILKLFNIKSLTSSAEEEEISKLIALIISDKSLDLKSIYIPGTKLDQSVTSELVKIKSITSLDCEFSDWESVELLSALTNLETVNVKVKKEFEMTSSKALCSLINTCSTSGVIFCVNWMIGYRNIESIISPSKRSTALEISAEREALSHIFKAFRSYRDLITIEELDLLNCRDIEIIDILQMAKVHPIKKLIISLAYTDDIEHLSDLAELGALEELIVKDSRRGSLIELFDKMAMKASPSLYCLKIKPINLSSKELVSVSKIRSLKKLELFVRKLKDCESLMELANSNIEELSLASPQFSLQKIFSAFAAKTTTRLQHLKITDVPKRYIEICELEEIAKIKSLKSLQYTCLHNNVSFLRNLKHLVKLDINLLKESNLEGLRSLCEFEQLESLTLRLNKYSLLKHYDFLADIQNLKELNLSVYKDVNVNLTSAYQAFVSKNVKLTHLTTSIGCVEELNEITQIKTLRKLHLLVGSIGIKCTCLGELSELESLQITVLTLKNAHILNSDDDYKMDCVLPILRCCRNLKRLLFNSNHFWELILRDIQTHLKSIRDPTVQGPLTVILTEDYNIPEILELDFENVYMKVFTSSTVEYLWYY